MMHFTDITALAGIAFAIAAFALHLPVATRFPAKQRVWLTVAIFIAVMLPLGGLSVAEFVRGIAGDLSITTLLLLMTGLRLSMPLHFVGASSAREILIIREQSSLLQNGSNSTLYFVAVFAFVFYPFALGLGMFDPYRLGFGDLWFITGLLLVALTAWLRQCTLIAVSISLAALAWSVGWYESNNLWDYLFDPWVSIYALGASLKCAWRALLEISRRSESGRQ